MKFRTPLWISSSSTGVRSGYAVQVVDDDGVILDDGPLVERPRELGRRVVGGVGEDARLLVARGVVQDEHAVSLHGREAEAQLGPPEERPELRLQPLEVRAATRSSPCR